MHKKWLNEPKYQKAYEALEEEFLLASAVIDVRTRAGLAQEELARKMGTTQPVVARLNVGEGARRCGPWSVWRKRPDRVCSSSLNRSTQRGPQGEVGR